MQQMSDRWKHSRHRSQDQTNGVISLSGWSRRTPDQSNEERRRKLDHKRKGSFSWRTHVNNIAPLMFWHTYKLSVEVILMASSSSSNHLKWSSKLTDFYPTLKKSKPNIHKCTSSSNKYPTTHCHKRTSSLPTNRTTFSTSGYSYKSSIPRGIKQNIWSHKYFQIPNNTKYNPYNMPSAATGEGHIKATQHQKEDADEPHCYALSHYRVIHKDNQYLVGINVIVIIGFVIVLGFVIMKSAGRSLRLCSSFSISGTGGRHTNRTV